MTFSTDATTLPDQVTRTAGPPDDRLAHLVMQDDWPIALCGAQVLDVLGPTAPGRDRCMACLKIRAERALGRPGSGRGPGWQR